jgi:hypothetical protein
MKKILLLLALSVTLFSTAQSTYLIQKPLRLETVNEGTKSDSVLVRGTDKIVKFVPRSEFSSNGETPNITQVLKTGNEDHTGQGIYLYSPEDDKEVSYLNYGGAGAFGSGSGTAISKEGIIFRNEIGTSSWSPNVLLKGSITTNINRYSTYLFPDKPNGTYTLATLDDISGGNSQNLQQTLENGKIYSDANGYVNLFGYDALNGGYVINFENRYAPANINTNLILGGGTARMSSQYNSNGKFSQLVVSSNNITLQKSSSNGSTTVGFENADPTFFNGKYTFKNLSDENEHFVATLDDIPVLPPTPNISQVLASGNTITDMPLNFDASSGGNSSYMDSGASTFRIAGSGETSFRLQGVYTSNPSFNGSNKLVTTRTDSGDAIFNLGNRDAGSYTVAVLSDIPSTPNLQGILDQTPKTAVIVNSGGTNNIELGQNFSSYFYNSDHSRILNYLSNQTYGPKMGGSGEVGEPYSYVAITNGELEISKVASVSGYGTHITVATPTAPTNIIFPAKSIGTYTVATTSDLIYTNNLNANIGLDIPSTATSSGTAGQVRVDVNYIYVCTAANTWVRSTLATW